MAKKNKNRLLSLTILKITASLCFVILLGLQYKLISDTYEVKNNEVFRNEKERIKMAYEKSIINDKLFPGGQDIIDAYLTVDKIKTLEQLRKSDRSKFEIEADKIYNDMLIALRKKDNVDSLMRSIFKELGLKENKLDYTFVIHTLSITFDGKEYVSFVGGGNEHFERTVVVGNKQIVKSSNMVSTLMVSSPLPYSNRVGFALYVEQENAIWNTLIAILPLLCLSGVSIFLMVFVFFFTFNNWIKQKKMNEVISDFVNSITHEYKTPISTIKVCIKNLRRYVQGSENEYGISKGLLTIERQSDRLNNLMDQVMYVSMFDPKSMDRSLRLIVRDVEEVLNDLRLKYEQSPNIEIQSNLPKSEYELCYNSFLFTTALINLVQNAIKYNNSENIKVDIVLKESDGRMILSVADNGIGIPAEDMDRIFDRFYQGKSSKNSGGIGLGLYYVKQLVVAHGWHITVHSKWNEGSVFSIEMSEVKQLYDEQ